MNKIYRVIYNETTNTYSAVAEFVKGKCKTTSATMGKNAVYGNIFSKAFIFNTVTSALLLATAYPVLAVTGDQQPEESNICYFDTATNSVICGNNLTSNSEATTAVAVGAEAKITDIGAKNAVAIGNKATVNKYTEAYDMASKSKKGRYSGASSIAIGDEATTQGSSNISMGHKAQSSGWTATAIGANSNAAGDGSVAIGNTAKTVAGEALGVTNSGGGVAIGQNSLATGQAAIAIGNSATTDTWRSIAIGNQAQTKGESTVAMGNQAIADGWGATSIGTISKSYGMNSTAVGNDAYANGTYTSAFGTNSHAQSDDTQGYAAALAVGTNTVALGNRVTSVGYNVFATGSHAIALGSNTGVHAIGKGNVINSAAINNAPGDYSMSFGTDTISEGNYSIALGRAAKALDNSAIAVGDESLAKAASTVAIGDSAESLTTGSIAVGKNSVAGHADDTSIWATLTNPTTGQKFASEEELKAYYDTIAKKSRRSDEENVYRNVVGKQNNIAIGDGAEAFGGRNIVMGQEAGAGVQNNYNIHNVSIGSAAGARTVGEDNVFVGRNSGGVAVASDKTVATQNEADKGMQGTRNVVIGLNAGVGAGTDTLPAELNATPMNKATGEYGTSLNVFIGNEAGRDVSATISDNVFIGDQAGKSATSLAVSKDGAIYKKADGTNANPYAPAVLGHSAGVGPLALNNSKGDMNVGMGWKAGWHIEGSDNVALGMNALHHSKGDGNVGVGAFAGEQVLSTDSVNIGGYSHGYGNESVAIGKQAQAGVRDEADTVTHSIAIGAGGTVASGHQAISIGKGAKATATNAISIGTGNLVEGENSGAIGDPSIVKGTNSYSLGNNNAIGSTTDNAISIGGQNNVGGTANTRDDNGIITTPGGLTDGVAANRSMVIGFKNNVNADDVMVLGNNITAAKTANNVILGNNAADAQATNVNDAIVNGVNYEGFAGNTSYAAVSVGAVDKKRQIKNVAAGAITAASTDAINGSQLYQVVEKGHWKLKANGENVDEVRWGDTVNFTSNPTAGTTSTGESTTVNKGGITITPTSNSTTSTIDLSVNVDGKTVKINDEGQLTVTVPEAAKVQNYFHVNEKNTSVPAVGEHNKDDVDGVGHATGARALAAGYDAKAVQANTVAVGTNVSAVTAGSIAIGENAIAGRADMDNPQDTNNRTTVGKRNNIAIGSGAVAEGGRNISIGENTARNTIDNWNIQNVNIGTQAGEASKKDYSVAVGYHAGAIISDAAKTAQAAVVDGNRSPSVYIGKEAGKNAAAYGGIGIGTNALNNVVDTNSKANIAIGTGAGQNVKSNDGVNKAFRTFGAGSNIMVGNNAGNALSGDGNTIVGNIAGRGTTGDNNFFGGHLAGADGSSDRSVIIGSQAGHQANSDRSVFIGNYANGQKKGKVWTAVAIGNSSLAGKNEEGTDTWNPIAIGNLAQATNDNTIALGMSANASGMRSTAIGFGANSSGEQAIAIGRTTNVAADKAGAIGSQTNISKGSEGSYALGNHNNITSKDTYVLGSGINTAADGTTALEQTVENSVYLGNDSTVTAGEGSVADGKGTLFNALKDSTEAGETTTGGAIGTVNDATVGGVYYNGFAGSTAVGAVSVGASGTERRIQNVAAGEISSTSTDAINGSQLYLVTQGTLDQLPVVYTNQEGDKLFKQPDGSFVDAEGNKVDPADVIASMNNGDNSTTTPMNLANIAGNLTPTYNGGDVTGPDGKPTDTVYPGPFTTEQAGPDADTYKNIYNNAATVGDVLNAGWNLQGNGEAKDFVKPYDTVNFVDGKGTTAEVTTDADGKVSNVTYNVDAGDIINNDNGTVTGPVANTAEAKKAVEDAKAALETAQNEQDMLPVNATDAEKQAAADKVKAAQDALKDAEAPLNKVATAQNVADAINASGFTLTTSKSAGEAEGTTEELINPGETVTIDAGKNVKVTQAGNTITVATKDQMVLGEKAEPGENGEDGKPGVDGKLDVNGADGKSGVAINGKDGSIGLKGADGKDGLSLTPDAIVFNGVDGKDGEDGQVSMKFEKAAAALDGKDGQTRIVYTKPNGTKEEVATMNDGLNFTGNNEDTVNSHKLNTLVKVQGEGVSKDDVKSFESAAGNINVEANGTDTLEIQLSKDIDLTDEGSVTIGNTVITDDGLTIIDGPSVTKDGINAGDKKITNVAAGEDDTDAVNVSQLKDAIGKNKTKLVDGKNTVVEGDGSADNPYKVNVADQVTFGEKGADGIDGVDGSIGVNGADGSGVVINGKDGSVGLKGTDGKDGLSLTPDAIVFNGVDGKDGEDGQVSMKFEKAAAALDGKDGQTRIVYTKPNGTKEEVATMNDGLNFTGNNEDTVNSHKLNTLVKVQGEGVSKDDVKSFESAAGNINVEANGTDTLEIQLSKDIDLTDEGSVTIGNTVITDDGLTIIDGPSVTKDGINAGDKKITNVAAGEDDTDAVNVSQLKDAIGKNKTKLVDGKNTVVEGDGSADNPYKVNVADQVTFGEKGADGIDGVDGSIGVNGADGSGVVINGKDGSVGLKGTDGKDGLSLTPDAIVFNGVDGKDGEDGQVSMKFEKAAAALDGKDGQTRIVYTKPNGTKEEVATMNDGLNFTGNNEDTVNSHKLNTLVKVQGEGVSKDDVKSFESAAGNINVEANGTDTLEIQLSKDIDLTDEGSVTIGNTVITDDGLTIIDGPSVTKDGINAGDKKITNVAAGEDDTDAVNVSQLKDAIGKNKTKLVDGKNTVVEGDGSADNPYKVNVADQVTFGEKGADGIDGVDGSIGVNGADGSGVVINGKDGSVGAKGADGKTGVTLNGKDGSIGINGKDGKSATLTVKDGVPAVDGKDGETKPRLIVNNEEVATMNDGLKFAGNNTDVTNIHKLNTKVNVVGEGVDKAASAKFESAAGNINVKADGNDTLTIQLNKDVSGLNSLQATTVNADTVNADTVKAGDTTVNNNGVTINNGAAGKPVALTKDGLNNGGNRITNVAPGVDDTDAVNVSQLKASNANIHNRIDGVENRANAGVAQAMATAGLPQAYLPGKSMMAIGGGVYRGETGYAIGFSSISDGGNWIVKGTASGNSRGNYGATAAVGYQW
ncbi:YadA-like family protein [Neisseria sp. CCUG17229]|uniref:YadA-like family protein n=1 Tax=Neisseria sp. CCUG17229 TaxID=3392036 RepID=UPI003A10211A